MPPASADLDLPSTHPWPTRLESECKSTTSPRPRAMHVLEACQTTCSDGHFSCQCCAHCSSHESDVRSSCQGAAILYVKAGAHLGFRALACQLTQLGRPLAFTGEVEHEVVVAARRRDGEGVPVQQAEARHAEEHPLARTEGRARARRVDAHNCVAARALNQRQARSRCRDQACTSGAARCDWLHAPAGCALLCTLLRGGRDHALAVGVPVSSRMGYFLNTQPRRSQKVSVTSE